MTAGARAWERRAPGQLPRARAFPLSSQSFRKLRSAQRDNRRQSSPRRRIFPGRGPATLKERVVLFQISLCDLMRKREGKQQVWDQKLSRVAIFDFPSAWREGFLRPSLKGVHLNYLREILLFLRVNEVATATWAVSPGRLSQRASGRL